jgi:hypothetical protein
MIWKNLVVASNKGKTLWACGIPNALAINGYTNILIAI